MDAGGRVKAGIWGCSSIVWHPFVPIRYAKRTRENGKCTHWPGSGRASGTRTAAAFRPEVLVCRD